MLHYNKHVFSKTLLYFASIILFIFMTKCPYVVAGICEHCRQSIGHSPICSNFSMKCCVNAEFNLNFSEQISCILENRMTGIIMPIEKSSIKSELNTILEELSNHPLTDSYKCKKTSITEGKKEKETDENFKSIKSITCSPCQSIYMRELTHKILKCAGESDIDIKNKKMDHALYLYHLSSAYALFSILNDSNSNTSFNYSNIYANWLAFILIDYYCDNKDNSIQSFDNIKKILDENCLSSTDTEHGALKTKGKGKGSFIRCILQILINIGGSSTDDVTLIATNRLSTLREFYGNSKGCKGSDSLWIKITSHSKLEDIGNEINMHLQNNTTNKTTKNNHMFILPEKGDAYLCMIVSNKKHDMKIIVPSTNSIYTCTHENLILGVSSVLNKILVKPLPIYRRILASAMCASVVAGFAFLTINNGELYSWLSNKINPEQEQEPEPELDQSWFSNWIR